MIYHYPKKRILREKNVDNRIPNPEFMEYYEFEREVLAINKTEGVKINFHYIKFKMISISVYNI